MVMIPHPIYWQGPSGAVYKMPLRFIVESIPALFQAWDRSLGALVFYNVSYDKWSDR